MLENTVRCVRIPVSDSKGNFTECIYMIYGTDGHLYTVNMYHTRSSSLVNGKSASPFLQTHFVSVLESMKKCMNTTNTTLEEVNWKMKAILLQCRKIKASKDSDDFEPSTTSDESGKSPLPSILEISENAQVDKEETIIRCHSNPLLSKSNNGLNVDSTTPSQIDSNYTPLNISLDNLFREILLEVKDILLTHVCYESNITRGSRSGLKCRRNGSLNKVILCYSIGAGSE